MAPVLSPLRLAITRYIDEYSRFVELMNKHGVTDAELDAAEKVLGQAEQAFLEAIDNGKAKGRPCPVN